MMYRLRKLTISQMTDNNILAHPDKMGKIYKKLNSLVSPENLLKTDDIFSVSILTSLPQEWLGCVSPMMNNKRVTPPHLINALKQEDLCLKARNEDLSIGPESVSNMSTNNHGKPCSGQPRTYYCTFCKREGHSLKCCKKATSILEDTSPSNNGSGSCPCGKTCCRINEKKPLAKAGQTTVVELGGRVAMTNLTIWAWTMRCTLGPLRRATRLLSSAERLSQLLMQRLSSKTTTLTQDVQSQ
jgi:hypothetical protein